MGWVQALGDGLATGLVAETLTHFKAAVGSCNDVGALGEHASLICTWASTPLLAVVPQVWG